MDAKDKQQQQASINVWGIANIGCEMENPTFQTLVVSAEAQMLRRLMLMRFLCLDSCYSSTWWRLALRRNS